MKLRPVRKFPGYFVSASGRVYSRRQGPLRRLKERRHRQGYVQFRLYRINTPKGELVYGHALVADAWLLARPSPRHELNHKNNIKSDNRRRNLEWGTKSHNCRHREQYRVRPAWSGRRTPARMIRALQMVAAGKDRSQVRRATGYSRSMVDFIFNGKCGVSVHVTRNGHEAKQAATA